MSSVTPKTKTAIFQGDINQGNIQRGYQSNLNHHSGAFGPQQSKGSLSPFHLKEPKREFSS